MLRVFLGAVTGILFVAFIIFFSVWLYAMWTHKVWGKMVANISKAREKAVGELQESLEIDDVTHHLTQDERDKIIEHLDKFKDDQT